LAGPGHGRAPRRGNGARWSPAAHHSKAATFRERYLLRRRVHNRPRAVLTSLGLGERTAAREHDFIALVGRSALARAAGSMPKTMPEISSASLPLLSCHVADAG
jgi:hypothetical protein